MSHTIVAAPERSSVARTNLRSWRPGIGSRPVSSSTTLPITAVAAWWGTAWLQGRIGPDEVADALGDEYVAHVVLGLPHDPSATPLLTALGGARASGATGFAAVLPEPGDPVGLGGPPDLTGAAIEAGQALLTVGSRTGGLGLVPHEVGRAIEWTAYPAHRRTPPDVGEADRDLRAALLTAAEQLARLDVARWRPEVADALHDLREGAPLAAPPGVPHRCVELARRAVHLGRVVALALEDDGAAVSAGEIAARREAVLPLGRAARRGLAAACSPDGWPPG